MHINQHLNNISVTSVVPTQLKTDKWINIYIGTSVNISTFPRQYFERNIVSQLYIFYILHIFSYKLIMNTIIY